jgi:hypothetical protein
MPGITASNVFPDAPQVHNRPGTNQKVHSQDAVDIEAIVHHADFDLETVDP